MREKSNTKRTSRTTSASSKTSRGASDRSSKGATSKTSKGVSGRGSKGGTSRPSRGFSSKSSRVSSNRTFEGISKSSTRGSKVASKGISKGFSSKTSKGASSRTSRGVESESIRPIKRRKSEIEEIRSKVEGREPIKSIRHLPPQSYTPKPRKPKAKGEEGVRLNKFIANSGLCSRREADDYIAEGLVTVNGETVTELGTKVFYSDEVRFDGSIVKGEPKVYILMNKPKDFITTTSDPHASKTVIDLVSNRCKERVYPVGRLDRDTTGVLLITNDGDLTEKLTHPSYNKKKIYQVTLDKNLKTADFEKVLKGVYLDDGMERADALSYVDGEENVVGIEIHSGKNRVVRRIFEALGYKVKKLDRVYFAGLTKKNLRRGQWRFLTEQELSMLKIGAYE